jgi:peroxiredoxin
MKKLLLGFCFLPLLATAQDAGKKFSLSGKTGKPAFTIDKVFIQYRVNGEWKRDSVQPTNGRYKFSGIIQEPVMATLSVRYLPKDGKKIAASGARDYFSVFLEPGKIKAASVDSFSNAKIKGSDAHMEYAKLKQARLPFDNRLTPLYAKYSDFAKAKDKENQKKTEDEIDAIDKEIKEKVYAEYVKTHSSSPIALYALQQYAGWEIEPEKVEPLFNTLSAAVKNYPSAIDFKENIEIAKKTGIGRLAMDFTQNDTLGQPVKLSSLKGHYVLVDFWASWCGPCRAENPNVVKAFNKFKDKNFQIIGVSLDRPGQMDKWMKAIHDDGLTWTHVSDLKFWDNEVAKQYGIRAIPQNLLLDPEGRIIAKNLNGEELDKKLGEAIEGKKAF